MSTLSIVVITVLVALFSILLLASLAGLIYVYILTRRQISSFSLTVDGTRLKLDSQLAEIRTLVASVHGDQISKASEAFLQQIPRQAQIATRIEQAVLLFKDLVVHVAGEEEISGSALDRARQSGLGPEDYATAAPGEHFVSRSRTAAGDAAALAEEEAVNAQSFGEEPGP